MYASLCDFVCIALLLPFVRGFCLSGFLFVCFLVFLSHVIIGGFVFGSGCSLLSFFLSFSFFFSFFYF